VDGPILVEDEITDLADVAVLQVVNGTANHLAGTDFVRLNDMARHCSVRRRGCACLRIRGGGWSREGLWENRGAGWFVTGFFPGKLRHAANSGSRTAVPRRHSQTSDSVITQMLVRQCGRRRAE